MIFQSHSNTNWSFPISYEAKRNHEVTGLIPTHSDQQKKKHARSNVQVVQVTAPELSEVRLPYSLDSLNLTKREIPQRFSSLCHNPELQALNKSGVSSWWREFGRVSRLRGTPAKLSGLTKDHSVWREPWMPRRFDGMSGVIFRRSN